MRKLPAALLAATAAALTLSMVFYPDASLNAAKSGLNLFLTIVFPSLLPFFILSEILLGLGVVHFIGILFEPLMRPVFNVPGEGAFALSMGLAAGYPMDAVIAARFRKQNLCNRIEGERLLAFTNTADPLFIFGAVAVGMFAMPALGGVLALAHYISAVSVGLIFRFYGGRYPSSLQDRRRTGHILARAGNALIRAREEDGRPLGRLAGDAVNDSVKTLLMICGFIMLFSVFVSIAGSIGLAKWLGLPFVVAFRGLGIEPSLVSSVVSGFFEIDLGTVAASQAVAPFAQKVMMASAIIAWSGLSVHGQVASVISGTDIRMGPYFLARLAHAVLAAIAAMVLVPVMLGPLAAVTAASGPGASGALTGASGLGAVLSAVAAYRGVTGPGLMLWSFSRSAVLALAVPAGLALAGAVVGVLTGRVATIRGRAPRSGSDRKKKRTRGPRVL